jgi:uncharacterized protein (UPF0147 family)
MFVNRDQEIDAFHRALASLKDGPEPSVPRLLSFTGLIGVGKTYLLEHLRQLARDQGIACALVTAQQPEPVALMAHWAEGLKERGLELKEFQTRFQHYWELYNDVSGGEAPPGLSVVLARGAMRAGLTLAELHPASRILRSFLDEDALVEQAGNWAKHLTQKLSSKQKLEDIDLLLDPIPDLTSRFAAGLAQRNDDKIVVLLLDDFEKNAVHLEKWLQGLIAKEELVRILWIIASWGGLSGEWRHQLLRGYRLLPFSPEGVETELSEQERIWLSELLTQFLLEAGISHNNLTINTVGQIEKETLGLPYMLNIASRRLQGEKTGETPSQGLVRRLREWIADDDRFQKVQKCAVARRLDRDIAQALLGHDVEVARFWDWLITTPLLEDPLETDPERLRRFNPILRTTMLRAIWETSRREYRDLHRTVADYYSTLIEKKFSCSPSLDSLSTEDPLWWTYHVEWYYHTLSESLKSRLSFVELALRLLGGEEDVFRRIYDIVRIFDSVATERVDAGGLLRNWQSRMGQAASALESTKSYTTGGFEADDVEPLVSFLKAVYCTQEICDEIRNEAAEWAADLPPYNSMASFLEDVYNDQKVPEKIRIEAAEWLVDDQKVPEKIRIKAAEWLADLAEKRGNADQERIWKAKADNLHNAQG